MKKRFLSVALALLTAIAVLPVCTASAESALLPYTGEEVTLTILGWESFTPINPETKFGQWIQEKLGNIKLEFEIPAEGTATKINMYLATGDMPDIMIHRDPDNFISNYGDGSRTINLLDYAEYMPEYMARRETYPHLARYDVDGATYLFFPCWYDLASEVWFMNSEIMNKYNLETPKNYEEMKAVMDTVLANEPDMFGMMFNIWGFDYQLQCFAHLFGAKTSPTAIYYDYDKDAWVYAATADEEIFRKAVSEMAIAYEKGYLHPDFASMTEETFFNARNNGTALFRFTYLNGDAEQNFYDEVTTYNPVIIDPPADEGVTPFIRTDFTSDTTGWAFMVSSECEYPELACSVLELFGSKELAEVYAWGWEDDTYTIVDGERVFTDSFLALSNEEVRNIYGITAAEPYTFSQFVSNFYTADAMTARWSEEHIRGGKIIAEKLTNGEYATYHGRIAPRFSDDLKQEISVILTAVNTYVTESIISFVLGNTSMDEWDNFIAQIPSYGDIDWVVEQYNSAEQQPDRPNQFERTWVSP